MTCWGGIQTDDMCTAVCKSFPVQQRLSTRAMAVGHGPQLMYHVWIPELFSATCRYSTLRTNLPRQVMSYSDFPFIPEVMGDKSHDSRRFPIHTEVLAWLGVFATTFDLMKHIHFNTIVTSLQPLALDARIGNNSCVVTDHPIRSRWQLKHSRVPARTTLQNKSAASASQQAAHPDEHIQSQPVTLTGQTPIHASAQAQPSACHSENGTAAMSQEGQQTPANSMASSSAASQNQNHAWANSHNSELDITAGPARDESSASSPQSAFNSNGNAQPASDAHHHDHQQEDVFDAVICCVGNYHQPNLPSVDGIDSFPGLQMHAHNYRTNAIFAGKRVMVIGSSFSGTSFTASEAQHCFSASYSGHCSACFCWSQPRQRMTRA